jgi:adenosylhomocysteine nucleosidase
MKSAGLGLTAALREECHFVLKWDGWRRREGEPGPPVYEREEGGTRIRLVVSGVGGTLATEGLKPLLHGFLPETVVSFGFGGALGPELGVADLIWGKRVFHWEGEETGLTPGRELEAPPPKLSEDARGGGPWREGVFVSVDTLVEKERVRKALDPRWTPAIVEMETYALSSALSRVAIPLVGLRAVSDELGLEIAPIISGWTDENHRVRGSRIIADLLRHPRRIGLLMGLFSRSRKASRSLATALRVVLNHWMKG